MPRAKRLDLRGPLLAASSLALVFLALELGFRGYERLRLLGEGEIWAVYDAELGYRLNPRFGDTNALGLRDHPVPPKSRNFRVLMLGDSVAYYGDDLDDTWVGHLRRHLGQRGIAGVEVINAGVKGYTNYQELLYLKRDGVRLEPELVGVGFVLNDLYRFLHRFRVEDGVIVGNSYDFSPEAIESVPSPLYRLLRRSRFLVWLRHRFASIDQGALLGDADGYSFEHRPDFRNAWRDEPWGDIESQLREMKQLGEREGFGIFLVGFPFGEQYRDGYLGRDRDYVLKPQRKLREICDRLAIPLLDLYPHLAPDRDLEADRIHLSAEGRRRVGTLVAEFLVERDLLGPAAGPPGARGG